MFSKIYFGMTPCFQGIATEYDGFECSKRSDDAVAKAIESNAKTRPDLKSGI